LKYHHFLLGIPRLVGESDRDQLYLGSRLKEDTVAKDSRDMNEGVEKFGAELTNWVDLRAGNDALALECLQAFQAQCNQSLVEVLQDPDDLELALHAGKIY
jgi:hypothetical protein